MTGDVRSVLTDTLAHTLRIHPYGPDLSYGFSEYANRIAVELADVLLGLSGVAVFKLPTSHPYAMVKRAAQLRLDYHQHRGAWSQPWAALTDAQKVPWIVAAAVEQGQEKP